jgi:hypothetical protein
MIKTKAEPKPSKSTTPLPVAVAPEQEGCTTSFLNQQKGEIGGACSPIPPESKKEYAQPDEEKESGGEA